MTIKKLFLAHYSGDAQELWEQATELRLRGIVPWVDKAGGFAVADESEAEARRAIREDCFGVLLYTTEHVFDRPFVRDVEINEAYKMRLHDTRFALFAVPRGISFQQLRDESLRSFNIDLSLFHTVSIPDGSDLHQKWSQVANEVLRRVLVSAIQHGPTQQLSLQYSTRELMPHEPDEWLCIDATTLLRDSWNDSALWERLLVGLQDIKRTISLIWGRPRLRVNGSKHLSAAFLFGRVFAPFELDIRQTPVEFWATDGPIAEGTPFTATIWHNSTPYNTLYLEIASGHKNIASNVDLWINNHGQQPSVRLQFRPSTGPLNVDNALCRTMVLQVYAELDRALQTRSISEIHIFAAAPQSFMMMLGRAFKGMPPVWLYEWDGRAYSPSCYIPAGIL